MGYFIIVIGTSAGGKDALCKLAATAEMHTERAGEQEEHISQLKELLFSVTEE